MWVIIGFIVGYLFRQQIESELIEIQYFTQRLADLEKRIIEITKKEKTK